MLSSERNAVGPYTITSSPSLDVERDDKDEDEADESDDNESLETETEETDVASPT